MDDPSARVFEVVLIIIASQSVSQSVIDDDDVSGLGRVRILRLKIVNTSRLTSNKVTGLCTTVKIQNRCPEQEIPAVACVRLIAQKIDTSAKARVLVH